MGLQTHPSRPMCLSHLPPGRPVKRVTLIVDNVGIGVPRPCTTVLAGHRVVMEPSGEMIVCPVFADNVEPVDVDWALVRLMQLLRPSTVEELNGKSVDVGGVEVHCTSTAPYSLVCSTRPGGRMIAVDFSNEAVGVLHPATCVKLRFRTLAEMAMSRMIVHLDVDEESLEALVKALEVMSGGGRGA